MGGTGRIARRKEKAAGDFAVHIRPDYLRRDGSAVHLDAHHLHRRFLHEGGTAGIGAVEEVERAFELRAEALQVLHHGHFAAGQDFHIDETGGGVCGSRATGHAEKQAEAEKKDGEQSVHKTS